MSSEAIERAKEADIRNILKEAHNLLHSDEKGSYWSGQFVDMHAKLHLARFKDGALESTYQGMLNVNQDMWNACTLIYRLEWLRNLAIKDESAAPLWREFASVDIEHFHVELRSILDYVANILGNLARKPKQVRSGSFRELYQWLDKNPGNRASLGEEATELVSSASWYYELRDIRDAILHHGASTLVFGSPTDGVLFQVHSGFQGRINIDTLMWNENVVDFQLYAGLYFADAVLY